MKQEEKDFRDSKVKHLINRYGTKHDIFLTTIFKLGWNLSHRYSRDKNECECEPFQSCERCAK